MEVVLEKKDELNAVLKISIKKEDYSPRVESELKKQAKKVSMPGFRPGHAPMAMVKKMYYKSIFVDEVNRIASESMFSYLDENNIQYLAQPILSDSEDVKIDFDKEEDFLFAFDLGLSPEVQLNISAEDAVTRYIIQVSDTEVEKELETIQRRNANQIDATVAESEDIIYMNATELGENNQPLEGGLADKAISVTPGIIKNEELKASLIGLKAGDKLTVNIFDLFNDNETVISNTLGIAKEGVNDLNKNFEVVVTDIKRYENAELNQELFDKVLGAGAASSLEEFKEKIKESLNQYYQGESEHMFEHQIDHLVGDKHNFTLPSAFLKRWLIENNPETFTKENIDEKFEQEGTQLRYVLLRNKVLTDNNVQITEEEVENMSLAYAADMIRNYGIPNADYELVKRVADNNKKEKGHLSRMQDMAAQRRFIEVLKGMVTPVEKEVGVEEYYALLKSHNEAHHH